MTRRVLLATWLLLLAPAVASATTVINVATTGNDTTGDGSTLSPYATLAKAISTVPAVLTEELDIDVASGTYAEPIVIRNLLATGSGLLKITGHDNPSCIATFTGTVSATVRGQTKTAGALIVGPARVEFEGLAVQVAGDMGIWATDGAQLVLDRTVVQGPVGIGVAIWQHSRLELAGNVSISGFSLRGLRIGFASVAGVGASCGTLSVSGGGAGWGIHLVGGSEFLIAAQGPSGCAIAVSGVQYGFALGFASDFTHQGPSGSITVTNTGTPTSSAGVYGTDHSSWSTTQPLAVDHFTVAFQVNSISYAEAVGSRSITNVSATTDVIQNSVVFLP